MHPAGGFRREVFGSSGEPIDEKYICSDCQNVLRDPTQVFCGHRYCRECLQRCLTVEAECQKCRIENEENEIALLNQNFPDNAIRRELNSMKAFCYFEGCSWTGSFKEFETNHFNLCKFKADQCPICHKSLIQSQEEYQTEGASSSSSNTSSSVDHISCAFKRCKLIEDIVGLCEDNGIRNINKPILERILICEENIKELRKIASDLKELHKNDDGRTRPSGAAKAAVAAGGRTEEYETESSEMVQATGGRRTEEKTGEIEAKIAKEKMDILEAVLTVMNKELIKLTGEMEAAERRSRMERETVQTMDAKIKSLERQLALKDASIADLDLKVSTLEQTSYDGTLMWKISDFSRKRQEAVTGRVTSFYSPAFYTSKTGFKMCARIYPNGDGMGKGTHVSLFFVVMRGQYDALLTFPFRHKVTLAFIDQNQRNHVTDTFKPDPTSSSFKRPTTEMNIASGCPLFMPISHLDGPSNAYVKDSIAFVKITISSGDS